MTFLDADSGGLHAVDMITLYTNMMQYYVQVEGTPQFIIMMEDAQKKQTGGHAHCQHQTCDDGLSSGLCGPTFSTQG